MKAKKIAVVGAGVMGSGVALDIASYAQPVILKDISSYVLEKAEDSIKREFKLLKMMGHKLLVTSADELLSAIKFSIDYEGFDEVDIVIENITESFKAKEALYKELGQVCNCDVIYGVNTSCISITKISRLLPQPENVIGLHFLNPAPMKRLVEVIKGQHTSADTVNRVKQFLARLQKSYVLVNDFPGFVTNRVLMLTINESIWLVQDGVAEPKDIDKIFKVGFGHKMGPLATADLIGLDTILDSLLVLYESYADPKYRPCPLLRRMVDAGFHGRKSGKGFFEYRS